MKLNLKWNIIFRDFIILFILLVVWEIAGQYSSMERVLSRPSIILNKFVEILLSGELLRHAKVTLIEAGIGYIIGISLGITTAFILGFIRILGNIFERYIIIFYGVPRLGLPEQPKKPLKYGVSAYFMI